MDRGIAQAFCFEELGALLKVLDYDQHERNLSLGAQKDNSPPSAWSRTKRTAIHMNFLTLRWSCDEGEAEMADVLRLGF